MIKFRIHDSIVLLLLILLSQVTLGEKKGAEVFVSKISGPVVNGELITVKSTSLLVLEKKTGRDISIDFTDIASVEVVNRSNYWKNMGFGLAIGGVFGLTYGAIFPGSAEPEDLYPMQDALIFGSIGLASGIVLSALQATEKTFVFENKPIELLEKELSYLRKKARM